MRMPSQRRASCEAVTTQRPERFKGVRGAAATARVGEVSARFTGEGAGARPEHIARVLGGKSGQECRMVHLVLRVVMPQPCLLIKPFYDTSHLPTSGAGNRGSVILALTLS